MTTNRSVRASALVAGAKLVVLPLATPASGSSSPEPSDEPSTGAATGSGENSPSTVTTSEGVEVTTFGTVQVRPDQDQDGGLATLAVNGVQRVDGGTVVYLSVGWDDASGEVAPSSISRVTTRA